MELHNVYLEIFKIYFGEQKKGFFEKMFGSKKKSLTEQEVKVANDHYKRLEEISSRLVDKLSLLQKRIHSILKNAIDSIGI
ncbi:MAG: hypothetical protein IE909_15165 [Campylobacterales bacterium]|nr:hypothetical protein [Campylobacterales bacterium]